MNLPNLHSIVWSLVKEKNYVRWNCRDVPTTAILSFKTEISMAFSCQSNSILFLPSQGSSTTRIRRTCSATPPWTRRVTISQQCGPERLCAVKIHARIQTSTTDDPKRSHEVWGLLWKRIFLEKQQLRFWSCVTFYSLICSYSFGSE